MNLREIKEEAWDRARDFAIVDADRLWPSKDMHRIINRVYRTIARETRCIVDTQTTSICLIDSSPVDYTTYTPGTLDYIWANDASSWLYQKDVCPYIYTLDPRIIQIDEVKWTERQWRLTKVSVKKWQANPWWEQVVGLPTEYATDLSNNTIALNFRSEDQDTLRLQVRRLPLTDLLNDEDIPEFRTHYHDFMLNGILYYMYMKQDADAIDKTKANEYWQLFQQDIDEIKQSETQLNDKLNPNYAMAAFR